MKVCYKVKVSIDYPKYIELETIITDNYEEVVKKLKEKYDGKLLDKAYIEVEECLIFPKKFKKFGYQIKDNLFGICEKIQTIQLKRKDNLDLFEKYSDEIHEIIENLFFEEWIGDQVVRKFNEERIYELEELIKKIKKDKNKLKEIK